MVWEFSDSGFWRSEACLFEILGARRACFYRRAHARATGGRRPSAYDFAAYDFAVP
jgi:hypothetical protein